MVKRPASFILAALASLSLLPVSGKDLGDYQVGDTAEEDIITPFGFVVIDAQGTQSLREKEAARVPVILRFDPGAADEVETSLRLVFKEARILFLHAVEAAFKRRELDAQTLGGDPFARLCADFEKQNKLIASNSSLLSLWARGESGEAIQAEFATRLREMMSRHIRPDTLPPDLKLGPQVRVLNVTNSSGVLTADSEETVGTLVQETNLYTLTRARTEFASRFDTNEQAAVKRMALLLKANCAPDAAFTHLLRAKRTEFLWAGDRYEPGQTISKRGLVIDAKTKAAISQLNEKMTLRRLRQQVFDNQLLAETNSQRNRSLLAGGLSLSLLLVLAALRLAKRFRLNPLLPARIESGSAGSTVITCPSCTRSISVPSVIAGMADAQVQLEPAALRAALVPHLARLMMNKLVHKLISQRATLLDTQQQATIGVADLEARLERIQAPLQERLRAYEKRITELERELAVGGEEGRAPTESKLSSVRTRQEG